MKIVISLCRILVKGGYRNMAMIKCPECEKEISETAESCPNCGYKLQKQSQWNGETTSVGTYSAMEEPEKKKKKSKGLIWVIVVIVALIVISNSGDKEKEEPADSQNAVTEQENQKEDESLNNEDKKDNKDDKKKETPKPTEKPKSKKQIRKEYIDSCKEYSYKKVLRNPEKYVGKKIRIKVNISSVHEESWANDTKYYFAYSKSDYGWYGDEYVVFDKRDKQTPKILRDDIVEVYGEIAEPEDTISLIVSSSELFAINMKYVKLIEE